MDIMYESVVTHVWAVYAFLLIMLFNLYLVSTTKNFMDLAKRLRFMTPIYHLTNAIIMYTGAIVATYNHDLNLTVILMIPASIFLMVIEIKRYKKMRVIKSDEVQLQAAFVKYAKTIYTIEITVLIAVYIVSKVF
ncbi:hypothetical protein [Candidatus Marinarcus aquaticus]|uniref:DUF2214 family protein n=1 Tax=Candidatus Marinarcus aquaticus TaxID=2044504 RepID=A0A4V1LNZ0_9BACT|nr:hypothetical protein [Candidatus Marinarcus aquaticus]RXJ57690.1 hypothetical protein CRV04_07725 [Candidatus Marinarcus aquaticus]